MITSPWSAVLRLDYIRTFVDLLVSGPHKSQNHKKRDHRAEHRLLFSGCHNDSDSFESLVWQISARWHGLLEPVLLQLSVSPDETAWVYPVRQAALYIFTFHTDSKIVPHFKMKMSRIHTTITPQGADLLSAFHEVTVLDGHGS